MGAFGLVSVWRFLASKFLSFGCLGERGNEEEGELKKAKSEAREAEKGKRTCIHGGARGRMYSLPNCVCVREAVPQRAGCTQLAEIYRVVGLGAEILSANSGKEPGVLTLAGLGFGLGLGLGVGVGLGLGVGLG